MNRYPVSLAAYRLSWSAARLLVIVAFGILAGALVGCGSSNTNTTPYMASLTQAQETPPTGSMATGTATFTLNSDKTQLTYSVTHNVPNPSAAHLHTGTITNAGPVTISLNVAPSNFGGTVSITQPQVSDLEGGRMYINIHTSANPDGEIRGQVIRPTEALYVANMRPTNEVPPVSSSATGAIGFILNADANQITYFGSFSRLTSNSTQAHFHTGAAGANGGVRYGLSYTPLASTSGTFAGQQMVDATDVSNMNSGNWYANVHSTVNPGGEIRDQVRKQ